MNRKELYYRTVDLLLDAYNNNTLQHGMCRACAVGNICGTGDWMEDFMTTDMDKQQFRSMQLLHDTEPYRNTGYTVRELMKIEFSFENSIYKKERPTTQKDFAIYYHTNNTENRLLNYGYWTGIDPKQGQLIGLTAVLDVLREIHQADIQESNNQKQRLNTIAKEKFDVVLA